MFSHEEDVACPCLEAIYNPGDIIGIDQLDNGWSRDQHTWLVANENCDIFLMATSYVNFMWDKMKKFKSNIVADMLQQTSGFSQMSEQTLFTIAHDIAVLKEYGEKEIIISQDIKSVYNLNRQIKEKKALEKFSNYDSDFKDKQREFLKQKYPKMQD